MIIICSSILFIISSHKAAATRTLPCIPIPFCVCVCCPIWLCQKFRFPQTIVFSTKNDLKTTTLIILGSVWSHSNSLWNSSGNTKTGHAPPGIPVGFRSAWTLLDRAPRHHLGRWNCQCEHTWPSWFQECWNLLSQDACKPENKRRIERF